jgi:cytochrome c peroxidase
MSRALKKLFLFLAVGTAVPAAGSDLQVDFVPRFNQAPLVFDSLMNSTAAGQVVSVTRLDFLLSDIALRRADGTWIGQAGWYACVSLREGRTNLSLAGIPAGNYDRIRFHIGLDPAVNHSNAAQWPAGHPLNPEVNHLYWGWSQEYVFLALEGHWQEGYKGRVDSPLPAAHPNADNGVHGVTRPASEPGGYSYHIATDHELMTVELPATLDLASSRELRVALDVDKIFAAPNRVELNDTTDTTHSRTNDTLAGKLLENIEGAFGVIASEGRLPQSPESNSKKELGLAEFAPPKTNDLIGPHATPYRLTISAFAPQPDLPRDNPLTGEGVALGGKLFFDRRLSAGNAESCSTCHNPRRAFSQNRRFSRGVEEDIGTRNAMPLLNLAWKSSFFWDGRAATLREQVLQPIQNPVEMHEPLATAVAKIAADTNYPRLFAHAFGSPQITSDRIARALEQFLLAQVSFDSKFDRVLDGRAKFTDEEQRGFALFNTEYDPYHGQYGADCFHCHGGPLFQSQSFANNGLDATFKDPGRYAVTKHDGDQGKFAVPSLRNVAVTAPYMHDGRFRTLEEAVEHYCTGMQRSATLDPNLAKHPDGGVPLSSTDKHALVAFLETLTDERFLAPDPPANPAEK